MWVFIGIPGTCSILVFIVLFRDPTTCCRGQLHLHAEWVQLLSADKQLLHYNRLANHFSDTFISAPVGGTCGGFLCDEMVSQLATVAACLYICCICLLEFANSLQSL